MICSKCGRQLPDTAKFCNGCGTPAAVTASPVQTAIPTEGMAVPASKRKGRVIAVIAIAAVLLGGVGFLFREKLFGDKNDSMAQAELETEPADEEEEAQKPEEAETEEEAAETEALADADSEAEPTDADEEDVQEEPEHSRPETPEQGGIFHPDVTEPNELVEPTMYSTNLRSEMTFTYMEDTTDPVESGAQESGGSQTDICTMFWFDTSQMKDFFFNGEFFVIEFRIREDAADGSYPVSISRTDIADWDLVTHVPELIDGEVAVGRTLPEEQAEPGEEFTLTVGSVRGDQGDIVRVPVKIMNNPGFVGCAIDLEYDCTVLEIVDAYSGSDFDHEMNAIY